MVLLLLTFIEARRSSSPTMPQTAQCAQARKLRSAPLTDDTGLEIAKEGGSKAAESCNRSAKVQWAPAAPVLFDLATVPLGPSRLILLSLSLSSFSLLSPLSHLVPAAWQNGNSPRPRHWRPIHHQCRECGGWGVPSAQPPSRPRGNQPECEPAADLRRGPRLRAPRGRGAGGPIARCARPGPAALRARAGPLTGPCAVRVRSVPHTPTHPPPVPQAACLPSEDPNAGSESLDAAAQGRPGSAKLSLYSCAPGYIWLCAWVYMAVLLGIYGCAPG